MKRSISLIAHSFTPTFVSITQDLSLLSGTYKTTFLSHTFSSISHSSLLITFSNNLRPIFFLLLLVREIYRELFVRNFVEHLVGVKMSGKGQSQSESAFLRFITSPIRALGRARDFYVRSITNCGHSMNYGNPLDPVERFAAFPRSHSVATSRSDEREDFAELVRAASVRTLANRINVDLVLKQHNTTAQQQQSVGSKGLPKSTSVGMAKIDEDKPYDFADGGVNNGIPDLYPRSKSYAVRKRTVAF